MLDQNSLSKVTKGSKTKCDSFYDLGQYVGSNKISKVVDSDNKFLVAEFSNFAASETVAVTRTDKEVIVEKTAKGYNGKNKVT